MRSSPNVPFLLRGTIAALLVIVSVGLGPDDLSAEAALWRQTKLAAFDTGAGDHFGQDVALSGDTAVVAAEGADPGGVSYAGAAYDCRADETVLDALLRQDADVPYSCRNGICLSCMMRCRDGAPPAKSQEGIKDTLRLEGHFLPCV